MSEKKNAKAKIWLYAVILFTSAFIVLLFTAYSQIKLNKNLSNYKDRISNTESERNKYQLNFTSAQETNNKLIEENNKLLIEKNNISEKLKSLEKENAFLKENNKIAMQVYDKLCFAQTNYFQENYVASAILLTREINSNFLDVKGKELYELLLRNVRPKAGKILYREGYDLYSKKEYSQAIEKLNFSFELAPDENFSGSCLYFSALCEDKLGNVEKAVKIMGEIISRYPDSYYAGKAGLYYEKHSK